MALVSGRALRDVDELFAGLTLPAVGQHGLEWRCDAGSAHTTVTPRIDLAGARHRIGSLVRQNRALLFEDKGQSLAVHFRAAPHLEPLVQDALRAIREELGDEYVLQHGKLVVEIRPRGVDKGGAIQALMNAAPFWGRTPVFVGDDETDENGFVVVNAMDGLSVKVGPGETQARWRLHDVDEVMRWLAGASDDPQETARARTRSIVSEPQGDLA